MDVSDFDFDLPESLIALRPAIPREAAKLLVVYPNGTVRHAQIADLPEFLKMGDTLVSNDTKVFPARLRGLRHPRAADAPPAKVEMLLHKRLAANCYRAFIRPAKKVLAGDLIMLGEGLIAHVEDRPSPSEADLVFTMQGPQLDSAIARIGEIPLPPYIVSKRKVDAQDSTDYQTIFARSTGSVAAPTAGLHFTPGLLAELEKQGISYEMLTLHVGPGTFLPVTVSDTRDHKMHAEWGQLSAETAARLQACKARGGRITAIGTTSLRTLETAARATGRIDAFEGETDIFITPGFTFKAADGLLTNFHLPRSTLFMLVCAFAGTEVMKAAYAEAIREQYRFYSYGDACLILRP